MPNLSIDLGITLEEFAKLVAKEVLALQAQQDWPIVEDDPLTITTPQPSAETLVVPSNSYKDIRIGKLNAMDIRSLRKLIAQAEGKDISNYAQTNKKELVEYVFKFETILGRTCEAEIVLQNNAKLNDVETDTDFSIPEAEDDTEEGELTREQAEGLDLAELKSYAVSHDVPEDDLKGLDVEAVVDLLFGANEAEEPVQSQPVVPETKVANDSVDEDDEEFVELSEEEIEAMSIGELKDLAKELNDDGANITVTRTSDRLTLIKDILDNLSEE